MSVVQPLKVEHRSHLSLLSSVAQQQIPCPVPPASMAAGHSHGCYMGAGDMNCRPGSHARSLGQSGSAQVAALLCSHNVYLQQCCGVAMTNWLMCIQQEWHSTSCSAVGLLCDGPPCIASHACDNTCLNNKCLCPHPAALLRSSRSAVA